MITAVLRGGPKNGEVLTLDKPRAAIEFAYPLPGPDVVSEEQADWLIFGKHLYTFTERNALGKWVYDYTCTTGDHSYINPPSPL